MIKTNKYTIVDGVKHLHIDRDKTLIVGIQDWSRMIEHGDCDLVQKEVGGATILYAVENGFPVAIFDKSLTVVKKKKYV